MEVGRGREAWASPRQELLSDLSFEWQGPNNLALPVSCPGHEQGVALEVQ